MRNIKLILEFDGTNYHGWLRQNNAIPTVQLFVELALQKLFGVSAEVTGCSRTDAGVHAVNYTANFKITGTIPGENIYKAINQFLPNDIKAKKSEEVPDGFHAVYSVVNKTYRYYFYFDEFESPLLRNYAWNAGRKLDISNEALLTVANRACRHFIGEHDFTAFKASGGIAKTTVRTIYSAEVKHFSGKIFYLEICGNGFLYNMVRIITGTIVSVIEGKTKPDEISEIIEQRKRKKAGMTAPPQGLYLFDVCY